MKRAGNGKSAQGNKKKVNHVFIRTEETLSGAKGGKGKIQDNYECYTNYILVVDGGKVEKYTCSLLSVCNGATLQHLGNTEDS